MKRIKPQITLKQLVERFTAIGEEQDKALLWSDTAAFNALFREMVSIENELKSRSGDQRSLLMSLYDHQNAQVRLNAAKATLAVAPEQARGMLETIANSRRYPQAGDAGMSIWNLDRGVYVPK